MLTTVSDLPLEHWRLKRDVDGLLWAWADRKGESVNSLSPDMLMELERIVIYAQGTQTSGLGFLSAKRSGFIAGFDVREFEHISGGEELRASLEMSNAIFDRLEQSRFPTACGIDGMCLGGGLELALSCRHRVATSSDGTRLGLPEVKLGLHPGFGGTVRLSRLIGGKDAVPLMLTGRGLRAGAARTLGLVDVVVRPHDDLFWRTRKLLLSNRPARRASRAQSMTNLPGVRHALAAVMKKQTAKQANPQHYPSPIAVIDLWREHAGDWRAMHVAERVSFARVFETDTARNLRRVFHLMEALKDDGKSDTPPVRRVHVIGAGVMGGDIAAWCAARGLDVTLQDRSADAISTALKRAKKLFSRRFRTRALRRAATARLRGDVEGQGVRAADVVIEAIVENLDAKRGLYAEIEPLMKTHALLATNTSALPLEDLSEGLARPGQFIGLHFFNPVAPLPLVEVIRADGSDDGAVERGAAFVRQIDKLPLVARSAPGFVVNRVLAPYLIEALGCVDEGIAFDDVDAAARQFGMPVGPIELADQIGLDVCLHVTGTLGKPEQVERVESRLRPYLDAGHLGKKAGQGFYVWKKGKPVRKDAPSTMSHAEQDVLAQRLITPLLDECERVLADGIVADADRLDAGVIFGTGFAPFRGGPLHYLSASDRATGSRHQEVAA